MKGCETTGIFLRSCWLEGKRGLVVLVEDFCGDWIVKVFIISMLAWSFYTYAFGGVLVKDHSDTLTL